MDDDTQLECPSHLDYGLVQSICFPLLDVGCGTPGVPEIALQLVWFAVLR